MTRALTRIALVAVCAARLAAQDSGFVLSRDADRPATPTEGRAIPRYPDILLDAGFGGEVRISYTIDSAGHVAPGSLAIERSTHELFGSAVRTVFPKWTFVPALVHGRPAAVRYEEVFAFQPARELGYALSEITAVAHDTVEGDVPRTTIGLPSRDPSAATFFSENDLLEAQRSVLALLANGTASKDSSKTGAVTLCVAVWRDGAAIPADTGTLRGLATSGRRAVAPGQCPRTYASMIHSPNTRAPKGWVDPFSLTVTDAEGRTRDIVRVWADLHKGTGTQHWRCHAVRAGSTWTATCSDAGYSIS
jgi:TonB family protein